MGSTPGNTTIRSCGKQHSGTNIQAITSTVFTFSTVQPNYNNTHQGNQTRFPEDMNGPHRKLINNHLEKSRNTTMGTCKREDKGYNQPKKYLLIYTRKKIYKNVMFCTTGDPRTTK